MTPASMRMLMILLFAAAVLNFTNYAFCWLYKSPSHHARPVFLRKIASPRTKRTTTTTPLVWSAKLVCDNQSSPGIKKAIEEPNDSEEYSARSMTTNIFDYFINTNKVMCPDVPQHLGPEKLLGAVDELNFEKVKLDLRPGGIYKPPDCIPRQSVAIIVPCRLCQDILNTFLQHLHNILMKQQLDYQIFVIEQSNASQSFNRGKVLNVGYSEAQHYRPHGWRCMIFHEPYLVPLDSRNLYRCSWYPRQLATHIERTDKSYFTKFGGAIAVSPEQFVKANGFSNLNWGSDAEYLNMHKRLLAANLTIERSSQSVGKYKALKDYEIPVVILKSITSTLPYNVVDGLSSLSYSVDTLDFKRTHTHIEVSIDPLGTEFSSWEKIRNQITTKFKSRERNTPAKT